MITKEVVEELPMNDRSPGFYSHLFLVRKKSGKWRPVIDLSALNKFIQSPHFKMVTPRTVIATVQPGTWSTSIKLEGRLLPCPRYEALPQVPQIHLHGKVYQSRVMRFGLTTAPMVFNRLLRVVSVYLHQRGIEIIIYFDDSLVMSYTQFQCQVDTRPALLHDSDRIHPSVEKRRYPFSGLHISSRPFSYGPRNSPTTGGEILQTPRTGSTVQPVRPDYGAPLPQNSGVHKLRSGGSPPRETTFPPVTGAPLQSWSPVSRNWEYLVTLDSSVKQSVKWFTIRDNVRYGGPLKKALSGVDFIHGRFSDGMGRIPGRSYGKRNMGPQRVHPAHNVLETDSCPSCRILSYV